MTTSDLLTAPGASVLTAPVDSLDRFGAMCPLDVKSSSGLGSSSWYVWRVWLERSAKQY